MITDRIRDRVYGRRKGHRLSPYRQQLMTERLPKLRFQPNRSGLKPIAAEFTPPPDEVWLEIGFGAGEHLVAQACSNPNIGFIGCEPFINGVANLLAEIDHRKLQNVRIYDGDASHVLNELPNSSIGRIFILFPDPWPKKRHRKRRFICRETVAELARIMRPGAELRLASDIGDYIRSSLLALLREPNLDWTDNKPTDWRTRWPDADATRYEEKAIKEGRYPTYLTFKRK